VRVTLISLMLAVTAAVIPVSAQALIQSYRLNIPRQSLDAALKDLAQQTGLQIARFSDTPGGRTMVGPVRGDMAVGQALQTLLGGSGLTYRMVNDRTIAVVAYGQGPAAVHSSASGAAANAASEQTAEDPQKEGKSGSSDGFRVAQAAPGAPAGVAPVVTGKAVPEKGEQLEEVIVTAEKRESTVQHTPVSLTAVSGPEIQERGIADLFELGQSIPGVSMRTSGPGQTEFEMRGMASAGGVSPTVGFYLDDIPLTAPATTSNGKVVIDPTLYDLNRVEALRGPQGTLYGSGSMGGTIKVITNPPNPKAFDASAEAVVSGTDGGGVNPGVNAMLNVPFLNNTAAIRLVGSDSHTSGWLDRIVIANGDFPQPIDGNTTRGNVLAAPVAQDYKNVNTTDLQSGRASLLWTPTDRFTLNGMYFYQHISQGGSNYIDSNPGTDAHYEPFDTPEPFTDNFNLASGTLKYSFDWFDISSTTSRWTRNVIYNQDAGEQWAWVLGLPSYYTSDGGIGPISTNYEQDQSKQFSEEVRLTSTGTGNFKWLLGYFYSDFTSYQNAFIFAPGAVSLLGSSNLFTFVTPTTLIQNSFFGDLSYQLTPQFKVSVGARRYSYDEEVHTATSGVLSPSASNNYFYYSAAEHNEGINPKFGLSYEPTETLMLYSTAAKGFRPGGGTGPIPVTGTQGALCESNLQSVYQTNSFVPAPIAFDPDDVWSYEVGEKLRGFDNRLTFNSAVYFADWKGIQQVIPLPCGYNFTANAGDAHIYGSEVELQALLVEGLTLSVNAGYTHARLVSSNVAGVGVNPGSSIQLVPEWTASQAIAYKHGLTNDLDLVARIENSYVGSHTDATFAINTVPAYDLTSIRGGVEGANWSAVLFVTNVFNNRVLLDNVTQISVNLPLYNRVTVGQPLTVGLDLTYHFGH
jgi:iron complex outermembrane receptor protein